MKLPALLGQLGLTAAITKELKSSNRLLPTTTEQRVLHNRVGEVEALIKASLQQNGDAERASVVVAAKTKGSRPLNMWRLQDRVLYRALVDRLKLKLPEDLQGRETHDEFERRPHQNPDNIFISTTDITAYYQYVDHDVLADELIAQTGDFHTVTALTTLLGQVMGGQVGIPQVHDSSDTLGDTYIDPIRRKLIRAGYDSYCYADDFRIGCANLGEARESLEVCAAAARELGLVLNDAKTFTYHRDTYAKTLGRRAAAAEKLLEGVGLQPEVDRFLFNHDYTDRWTPDTKPVAPDLSSIDDTAPTQGGEDDIDVDELNGQRDALMREVWRVWTEHPEQRRSPTVRGWLGQALPVLGHLNERGPVEHLEELLDNAPDLTPQVADYLTHFASTLMFDIWVDPKIFRLLNSDRHSEWQKLWLIHAAGSLGHHASSETIEWLNNCVSSGSQVLAAYSADALGRLERGDFATLTKALDRVTPEFRPPIIWALGQLDTDKAQAITDSKIDRLMLPPEQA
ncbi:RNA-directed DNA polymerase [Rhodococcus sp. (in: high G+C Gram-positive bacteria)]|uniref:RNA-directed DNA polymerase n=1 Tax=Rhodococcus sp. TaxID=1831 RepID=UPI00257A5E4A|nr:RNA-directed DNA polymerase [Rhodococcus sp. (in: high G+C Gram-positive bacteria)]MBQ9055502.1 RNA-directed DNA polymerase [Rhodococcus sp. (in: high G+C Gram-positive bacteria)]